MHKNCNYEVMFTKGYCNRIFVDDHSESYCQRKQKSFHDMV